MVEEIVSVDRELFQHQCRAAYLDITNDKEAEKYCQECARHMGWKFTRLTGDASFLRDLLAGHHDPSRFVIAQPGEALALDAGGALTQA
jgi:hypothetical protein